MPDVNIDRAEPNTAAAADALNAVMVFVYIVFELVHEALAEPLELSYFPANNEGIYACVGCGRCVGKCPMHVNIAKVIRALGGKQI
jgi:Fe-S oxidoreductase